MRVKMEGENSYEHANSGDDNADKGQGGAAICEQWQAAQSQLFHEKLTG